MERERETDRGERAREGDRDEMHDRENYFIYLIVRDQAGLVQIKIFMHLKLVDSHLETILSTPAVTKLTIFFNLTPCHTHVTPM